MKQTLRRRWNNLFPDASIERSQYTFQLIWGHYNDGLRDYHTLEHIASALEALDTHFPNAPRATELAIWLHDLIYIPGDSRNEEMSAHFGAYILAYLDESPAVIEAAHEAIRATAQHVGATPVACMVCDIDLLSLALPADMYDANTRRIRQEYSAYDEARWTAGRLVFIERFLARETIFQTEELRKAFEQRARKNLERERERLLQARGPSM